MHRNTANWWAIVVLPLKGWVFLFSEFFKDLWCRSILWFHDIKKKKLKKRQTHFKMVIKHCSHSLSLQIFKPFLTRLFLYLWRIDTKLKNRYLKMILKCIAEEDILMSCLFCVYWYFQLALSVLFFWFCFTRGLLLSFLTSTWRLVYRCWNVVSAIVYMEAGMFFINFQGEILVPFNSMAKIPVDFSGTRVSLSLCVFWVIVVQKDICLVISVETKGFWFMFMFPPSFYPLLPEEEPVPAFPGYSTLQWKF